MAGPSTWNDLITQINAILDNFAESVGEDVVSSNVVDATDFTKATGAYVNSPDDPWTSGTIPLNLTGAVRGGISAIWYKGAVLTKSSFSGGVVTMFSGLNITNELCRVFIDYDAVSEAFSVNIQTGFTGNIPNTGTDTTPPATMEITSVISGDTTPPETMIISTLILGDTIAPATMEITSVT